MRRSENIGNLVKSLAAAQGAMKPLIKDRKAKIESQKGNYSYSYADLASVIDCYREPLARNGLALMQPVGGIVDGHLILTTLLAHESGEWVSEDYPVPVYQRPQEQGSAITYARRYQAQAMLGLASEDDDGATAQTAEPPVRARREEPRPERKPSEPKPSASEPKPSESCLTDADIEEVGAAAKAAGFGKHSDLLPIIREIAGAERLRDFPVRYKADLIGALARIKAKRVSDDVEEVFGAEASA